MTCEEVWGLPPDELWRQIVIWTGIANVFSSGTAQAAHESAMRMMQIQLKLREELVDLMAQGFVEEARAVFMTWLQNEGYVIS